MLTSTGPKTKPIRDIRDIISNGRKGKNLLKWYYMIRRNEILSQRDEEIFFIRAEQINTRILVLPSEMNHPLHPWGQHLLSTNGNDNLYSRNLTSTPIVPRSWVQGRIPRFDTWIVGGRTWMNRLIQVRVLSNLVNKIQSHSSGTKKLKFGSHWQDRSQIHYCYWKVEMIMLPDSRGQENQKIHIMTLLSLLPC